MDRLPNELLLKILGYVKFEYYLGLRLVCKRLDRILTDILWRRIVIDAEDRFTFGFKGTDSTVMISSIFCRKFERSDLPLPLSVSDNYGGVDFRITLSPYAVETEYFENLFRDVRQSTLEAVEYLVFDNQGCDSEKARNAVNCISRKLPTLTKLSLRVDERDLAYTLDQFGKNCHLINAFKLNLFSLDNIQSIFFVLQGFNFLHRLTDLSLASTPKSFTSGYIKALQHLLHLCPNLERIDWNLHCDSRQVVNMSHTILSKVLPRQLDCLELDFPVKNTDSEDWLPTEIRYLDLSVDMARPDLSIFNNPSLMMVEIIAINSGGSDRSPVHIAEPLCANPNCRVSDLSLQIRNTVDTVLPILSPCMNSIKTLSLNPDSPPFFEKSLAKIFSKCKFPQLIKLELEQCFKGLIDGLKDEKTLPSVELITVEQMKLDNCPKSLPKAFRRLAKCCPRLKFIEFLYMHDIGSIDAIKNLSQLGTRIESIHTHNPHFGPDIIINIDRDFR